MGFGRPLAPGRRGDRGGGRVGFVTIVAAVAKWAGAAMVVWVS
jgi:hypothetical protein